MEDLFHYEIRERIMKKYPNLPILLIDDNRDYLDSLELSLIQRGITNIIKCDDSQKAMKIILKDKISIVISDLTMPNISGYEILLCLSESKPEIPVIIVTGNIDSRMKAECLENGAYAYFNKQDSQLDILNSIVDVLKK